MFYIRIYLWKLRRLGYFDYLTLLVTVLLCCRFNSRRKTFAGRTLATGKTVSKPNRFKSVSDAKLKELKTKWMKKRTFNKMQWGVRAFQDWRSDRLSKPEHFDVRISEVDFEFLGTLNKSNLSYALCKFIAEVTKKHDGSDYPGKTLYEMIICIQKYLNQREIPWRLIEDPEFMDVKNVLDNVMKERAQQNIGMVAKRAEFISLDYENELWRSGTLGEDSPDKLRDTVLFILGINLALHAGDEHHDLRRNSPAKCSQISFERDIASGKRCLVYREDTVTKTNDGGLANMKKQRKVVWIFPNDSVVRCPVRLVDKYVSLCPEVTEKSKKCNFYLRSLEKPNPAQWFSTMPVGKNTLSKTVGRLLKSCNLDGYFTNHSLRRTSATRLFQAGVDKKIVREITGHVSDTLDRYQQTSMEQKANVSKILTSSNSHVEGAKSCEIKVKSPKKTVVPSLDFAVTDKSENESLSMKCECQRKQFNVGNGDELARMINEIVSQRKSGKAKIKLEIEFSD